MTMFSRRYKRLLILLGALITSSPQAFAASTIVAVAANFTEPMNEMAEAF
jgi:molybdate transport system substrate-binding protein